MKKILVAVIGVMMLCAIPLMASADTFTFSQSQLLAMTKSFDTGGLGDLLTITPDGTGAWFYGNIDPGTPQWRSIGIGFPWGDPGLPGDLSAFDSYAVTFLNENNQTWWVNLYMNTGWTDPPNTPANNTFSQNGWTELAVGQSATLLIDFAGVPNLNQVTNIGFQFAFNSPFVHPAGYQGDDFNMKVTPAPEPMTLLLLGLGLVGIAGAKRKFKK